MERILALISMIAGLGAGTLALIAARKQLDKRTQLRGMSTLFFGIAGAMAIPFFF